MATMKLFSLAMLVAFTAGTLATPADIYLKVKSENSTMGLTYIREGDALNYVFLAAGSQLLPFYLELFGSALVVSIGENPARFRIDSNGYLTYNGSVSALYLTDSKYAPIGSIPFTIYADFGVSPNISTTSSTASTTSMKSSTATAPYSNATSAGKNISAIAPPPAPSAGAAAVNEIYCSLAIATTLVLAMLL
ncbi:hypothetical protein V1527DRAFT_493472 [Lipomyces starkeyi]